jgi:hypothetical protein
MLANVVNVLFGCWHRKYSFPITAKKGSTNCSPAASVTGTYVVCLDCGKEFPYDWERMKILSPNSPHAAAASAAPLPAEPVPGFGKVA